MIDYLHPKDRSTMRGGNFRLMVISIITFLLSITSPEDVWSASVKVSYSGGVNDKFVNLDRVLQQLLETLERPKLWGDFWSQKVRFTGNVTNYYFKDIAQDLKKYLSDGALKLEFRPNEPTIIGTTAAQTVNRNWIILFSWSGRAPNKNVYSDYILAQTLFHELMHVWQYDHWTRVGRYMDYESFPTNTDKMLPATLFSTKECKDPGGSEPVPTGNCNTEATSPPIKDQKAKTITGSGILKAPGNNRQAFDINLIDAKEFIDGGSITINITLGKGKSDGSFDLFPENVPIPVAGRPKGTVAGSYDVPSGSKTSITYRFTKGQVFQFGATGNWFSKEGDTNTYTYEAEITGAIPRDDTDKQPDRFTNSNNTNSSQKSSIDAARKDLGRFLKQ